MQVNSEKAFVNMIWKFCERFGLQMVTFIVSIVLARILSPEEYGIVTIVLVLLSIADVFVTGGFGNALIQKKNVDELDFSSVFYFNIVFSSFVYIIFYLIAPFIADFYDMPLLCELIRVLSLRLLLSGINSIQNAYISITMQFKKLFLSSCIGCVISSVIGIYMALHGYGAWSIVGQYLSSSLVNTIMLFAIIKWRPHKCFSFTRLKLLIRYGWKLMCSSFLDTVYQEIRSLLIGKVYSSEELAYFDKANQYPKLLANNINVSISSVLFPIISSEQDNLSRVKHMTRLAIQVSSFVVWPAMVGLAVTSETWVLLLLSEKWLPSVPYVIIACVVYAMIPINVANLEAIKAIGRSDVYFILEIIKKAINIVALFAVMNQGVYMIAIMAIPTGFLGLIINSYPNTKFLSYSICEQVMDVLPNILISCIMGLVVYLCGLINIELWLRFFIQICVGVIAYVVFALIFRNSSFKYLVRILKKLLHKNIITIKDDKNGENII